MLKSLELSGFKSFAKKTTLEFNSPITAIVGPNGSGKSNVAEAVKFVLGEQSHLSMRTRKGEDLIWNGSKRVPAMSRAAVAILFDNRNKVFKLESELAPDLDLNFDEIKISREVYRDGGNRYLINGTQVRLRDIVEMLASVNIGASGHHIISQGEADRILNASAKDRRIMIEEALGLKIYHWKIHESEKKLLKTNENLDKADSLRRELLPHLKFLKKQVEKVEKAEEMKIRLTELYGEYLKKEETYLAREKSKTLGERQGIEKELSKVEETLSSIKKLLAEGGGEGVRSDEAHRLEMELRRVRSEKDELSRKLGRIEANLEFTEKEIKTLSQKESTVADKTISLGEIQNLAKEIDEILSKGESAGTLEAIKSFLKQARSVFTSFISRHREGGDKADSQREEISKNKARLEKEKNVLETALKMATDKEDETSLAILRLKKESDKDKDEALKREKAFYELSAKKSEFTANMKEVRSREEVLRRDEEAFLSEIKEGNVLVGTAVLGYKNYKLDESAYNRELRQEQEGRKKEIEKLKIRLEDMGADGSSELLKEYHDIEEREQFLSRETEDLKKSADSLEGLIAELREKLDTQFDEGIVKINKQFQHFFALMFGGGTASIFIFEEKKKAKAIDPETGEEIEMSEEEEPERGIEIKVNLPQKKIKDLAMLSGGERALTSIALLFAISQVNPPPFMVLDETDAALDEANSRKYGDMLENLSKLSQLVVITHNRETMSRAGILYGVTTGGDAASKLLSIKFEEAVEIAK